MKKLVLGAARLQEAAQQTAELSQVPAMRDSGPVPWSAGISRSPPENQAEDRKAAGRRLIRTIPTQTRAAAPRIPGPMGSSSSSHPSVNPKTGVRNEKLATPEAG